jgi:hypothetical protein
VLPDQSSRAQHIQRRASAQRAQSSAQRAGGATSERLRISWPRSERRANGQIFYESKPRSLRAEGAVERDYSAFESGGSPETRFISRVQALETLLSELRARLEDLRESERKEVHVAPTAEVMRNPEEAVRDAIRNGMPGQRKALLKELVVEVRVESRDSIIPTFRIPTTPVRVMEAVVGRGGLEPPTSAVYTKCAYGGHPPLGGDEKLKASWPGRRCHGRLRRPRRCPRKRLP